MTSLLPQPFSVFDNPFRGGILPSILFKLPLVQLETIPSCPITCNLGDQPPHYYTLLSDSSESKLAATSLLVQAWCHGWSCYLMYICCWQAFTGLFLVGCFPAAPPLPAALQGLWPLNTCKALKGEHLGNKLIKGCSHVCSRKTALYSYRASKLG